jgi:vitamin B12 transporter
MTIITRQEIEQSKMTYVTDILQTVPGLDFRSKGPRATDINIGIRGMQGYHTKLLVNGIPMQDTSGTQVSPVFNSLTLANIERIEVLRGTHSTLYGSSAIGGVINIITRKGQGEGAPTGNVSAEVGSHGSQKYAATFGGIHGTVDYNFSADFTSESGISAKNDIVLNTDDDAFQNENYSGRLGWQMAGNLRLELFGSFNNTFEEYDNGSAASAWGAATPDSGDTHHQRYQAGTSLSATDLFHIWNTSFTLSINEIHRGLRDSTGWGIGDRFEGTTDTISWQNELQLNQQNKLSFGYDFTAESVHTADGSTGSGLDERHRTDAFFLQHQLTLYPGLHLTGGLRYNDHSLFGEETTYSASAAYHFEQTGTTLKASYGTGYRAPSLYELYDPNNGNADLSPETSESWDLGFEQQACNGKVTFGMNYFENRTKNAIDWTADFPGAWTGQFDSISGIKTHGIESFVTLRPMKTLALTLSHTYQHTNNMEAESSPMFYRPRQKTSATLNYSFLDGKANLNLNALYAGHQNRSTYESGSSHLDGYLLANAALSYDLTANLQVYGRIHNLLNENYEVVRDYNTLSRSCYAGMKYSF